MDTPTNQPPPLFTSTPAVMFYEMALDALRDAKVDPAQLPWRSFVHEVRALGDGRLSDLAAALPGLTEFERGALLAYVTASLMLQMNVRAVQAGVSL